MNHSVIMNKYLFIFLLFSSCRDNVKHTPAAKGFPVSREKPVVAAAFVGDIVPPVGFFRDDAVAGTFAYWLRNLKLKKKKEVYLYNGSLKPNQAAQYAVIDISTGTKDLQQCADVVMRLRAAYLFSQEKYTEISFQDYNGKKYEWKGGGNRKLFESYLENVFSWCGSASLEKQLEKVKMFEEMQIGDVLIKGGFPGHAVIVVDMAINKKGEKMYMLVQGYQPAQDMHLLINPSDDVISPWYKLSDTAKIVTPEWTFYSSQLKRWPSIKNN
jgi:Domain of unknown function (4846)